MMHLASLVLTGNKTGSKTDMMKYEFAGPSDKMNLKLCLKLMPGFLISLQRFRGRTKVS